MIQKPFFLLIFAAIFSTSAFAEAEKSTPAEGKTEIIVSVKDQKLALVRDGEIVRKYKISTSRFGIGDSYGSYRTPLGRLTVSEKIGAGLASGSVLKCRRPTGEVLQPNAPGRDPIVSRILWLNGDEAANRNAHERGVYIHGTPDEKHLGRPASYGCIRMASADVIELFTAVPVGTQVSIVKDALPGSNGFLAMFAQLDSPKRAPSSAARL